jgi:hypothetical protein
MTTSLRKAIGPLAVFEHKTALFVGFANDRDFSRNVTVLSEIPLKWQFLSKNSLKRHHPIKISLKQHSLSGAS